MSSRSDRLAGDRPRLSAEALAKAATPALLVFLGYFVPAALGSKWSIIMHAPPAIWPAAGVAVGCLAVWGLRYWPFVALAMLAAFQLTDNAHGPIAQLTLALSKAAASVAGAVVLRRGLLGSRLDLTQLRDVWVILAAGCAAALIGMVTGVTVFWVEGQVQTAGLLRMAESWFLGDAIGVFIFGTLVIAWAHATDDGWTGFNWLYLASLLLLIATVSWAVYFGPVRTTGFYVFPLLIWAAFNLRAIGASTALAVVSLIAVAGTTVGVGPFAIDPDRSTNVLLLQQYLAVSALMTLVVAAVSEERRQQALTQTQQAQTLAESRLAELHSVYESAPIGLAFFDRDYRYLRINDELAAINGVPASEHVGRRIREVLPGDAPTVEPILDRVFATGETIRDVEVSGETPQQPGVRRHWLTGFYPVQQTDGSIDAVGIWVVEITERKRAEEREALLAREVDHRAKNLLAVVQSVVQLTKATDTDELKSGIVGRIQSLARAHALLADARWDGAQLGDLVREELAPYLDATGARVSIDGPPLLLRPAAAQSVAIVLHELATNAAKYGALSSGSGRLEVRWSRDDQLVTLTWLEQDGPSVKKPKTSGFGSRIIKASIERQLHGTLEQDWRPEGLQCTIRISTREALGASELRPTA